MTLRQPHSNSLNKDRLGNRYFTRVSIAGRYGEADRTAPVAGHGSKSHTGERAISSETSRNGSYGKAYTSHARLWCMVTYLLVGDMTIDCRGLHLTPTLFRTHFLFPLSFSDAVDVVDLWQNRPNTCFPLVVFVPYRHTVQHPRTPALENIFYKITSSSFLSFL